MQFLARPGNLRRPWSQGFGSFHVCVSTEEVLVFQVLFAGTLEQPFFGKKMQTVPVNECC